MSTTPSMSVKGTVVSHADFYFNGELDGTIDANASVVTIGPAGKLNASIKARKIIIFGSVKGNLAATESVELRKTGRLVGDLVASRIAIEDGAYFEGSVDMHRQSFYPAAADGQGKQRAATAS